jgi:UDP-4-amino-4-deoxy-L-arabinose-oxoglutarate aminotransferase
MNEAPELATHTFVAFSRPTIEAEEIDSVVDSLRSGWLTTGAKVLAFETGFRERVGAEHALSVNSGTAGMHVVLAALGIGPGDEVITASLTWPSTVNVIELLGARPVFADVHPDTLLIDPEDVRRRLTDRTRAVVPVHYAGAPADLDALRAAIGSRPITLVEDAAHALGTIYKGREVGSGPNPAVFSFHPIKNITSGEGGMVTLSDGDLAQRIRLLRFHGISKDAWARYQSRGSPRYEVIEPGWKYNMLDLQAALGIEQLRKLNRFNARRAELAARYRELLDDVSEVRLLGRAPYEHVHSWHLLIARLVPSLIRTPRDDFMGHLTEAGIGVGLHFTPVHQHHYYADKYGLGEGELPHTEAAGETIFSLPLYPLLTEREQDRVVAALKDVVTKHRVDCRH